MLFDNPHYTASNSKKTKDQQYERNWSWPKPKYYSGIYMEGLS